MNNSKLEFEMKTHHLTSFESELKGSKNAVKSSSLYDLKDASTGNAAAITHPGIAPEVVNAQFSTSRSFYFQTKTQCNKTVSSILVLKLEL
jgi:hypothetical protein